MLVSGRHFDSILPLSKLRIRNESKGSIGSRARSCGERAKTGTGRLWNAPLLGQHKSISFKDRNRLADRWQLPADGMRGRPVLKQSRKSVELVAECSADQSMAPGTQNPAKLSCATVTVLDVMPHVRQPRQVTTLVPQWDALGTAGNVCQVRRLWPSAAGEHAA